MNTIARNLVSAALLLWGATVNAALMVDQKYTGSLKNVDKVDMGEWKSTVGPFYHHWETILLQNIAQENNGVAPSDAAGRNSGHILWNGKSYYAWAVH